MHRGLARSTLEDWLVDSGFALRGGHGLELTEEGQLVSYALASWP